MEIHYLWFVFAAVFFTLLFADLFVVGRKEQVMSARRAVKFVLLYVAVALAFGILVSYELGHDLAASYYAAYVLELSMSVDNLFVFIIIFGMFHIPSEKQHKVLYWGILGAIVFRAIFIVAGSELLNRFDFMLYIFGVILLYTAYKTAFGGDDDSEEDRSDSLGFRVARKLKATTDMSSGRFFTWENGKRVATPMFLCLVVIEISDIMFAFDSVPAALSISTDIFVVYTSNIFAIMGLRSMYFVIKDAIGALEYLPYGLGAILAFIGVKMLLSAADILEIGVLSSLIFIIVVLAITILASLIHSRCSGSAGGQ